MEAHVATETSVKMAPPPLLNLPGLNQDKPHSRKIEVWINASSSTSVEEFLL